ncbi:ABC transporter ATP-binding protein [Chelatococcus sambhunathii]|uniref:ABC transporter ATP-binding protein n=1 Tax=Chelatococcus sambhunathii TaxID=363953 RepID=A0ABU1DK24_9HYPH|nr:ABC transporter ATP-binding protein [Chelatococcus sambhunathii]MDR4308474.1 ABC transporter ATP-binding protein [Chelatococcus sambhunathii]
MQAPAVRLEAVTKLFDGRAVVDEVSLDVASREILSLVGASGCGKSTLLRLVSGLERPDGGAVSLAGEVVAGPSVFVEPERRGVGFIFQDYALFPHLTVARNVRYGLQGLSAREAADVADDMLERVGLKEFGQRYPHMLSGGEQQRVALARALAPKPRVLLLDEPFSNLDRRLGETVRTRTLALIRELGAAAILVTHDPQEAMASGDRVALMRRGRLVQIGRPEDLYDRPASREAADFFAAATPVPGRRVDGHIETRLGRFRAPDRVADGGEVAVYLRAPHVALTAPGEGVEARLVGMSFVGDGYEFLLQVDGLDEPIRARSVGRNDAKIGDVLHICVRPDDQLIFPVGL